MGRSQLTLWFIVLITLFAAFIDLPFLDKFPIKLGLDLQGGIQLVLQGDFEKIDPQDRDTALESAREVIEKRVNLFGVSEAVIQSSRVREERRILVELPGVKDASTAANLVGKTAKLEFRELRSTSSADFISTDLTGSDLKKAQVSFGSHQGGAGPQVAIEFNPEGAQKFAKLTGRNIGQPLAIFLDDRLVSTPVVQQEIIGGSAVITGNFSIDEAKQLSIQLNAGALPVPIKIIQQSLIGPSLGQESVNKSLVAGVIGLLVVAIYMALYYGFLGIVADIALLIYTILILAIFKTGLFILPPITLTLAGIAGFILSIGMAVDANILIFERMKEELRWGRSKLGALDAGFKRAWSSIWASNVSSLITAVILYYFGTSLIRGFAITLILGVLVSMFSSYVVSRTLLKLIVK